MLHLLLYGALAIVIGAILFAVAARFLPAGEQIAPPVRDEPPWELPADRPMRAEEVDAVRLPVALRGYRFAETDTLLDRLAEELRARDAEIARLRGELPAAPEPVVAADGTAPVVVAHPDERLEEELAVAEAVGEAPAAEGVDNPPGAVVPPARPADGSGQPGDEPSRGEPAQDESADEEPAQPAQSESAQAKPAHEDPAQTESADGEPAQTESADGEPAQAEPAPGESPRTETPQTEPAREELISESTWHRHRRWRK